MSEMTIQDYPRQRTFVLVTRVHQEKVVPDNSMGFISDSGGATYNLCRCWSSPFLSCVVFTAVPRLEQLRICRHGFLARAGLHSSTTQTQLVDFTTRFVFYVFGVFGVTDNLK
jgi:hypothetical protein